MRAAPVTMTVINVLTSCFFSTNQHRALGNDTQPRLGTSRTIAPPQGTAPSIKFRDLTCTTPAVGGPASRRESYSILGEDLRPADLNDRPPASPQPRGTAPGPLFPDHIEQSSNRQGRTGPLRGDPRGPERPAGHDRQDGRDHRRRARVVPQRVAASGYLVTELSDDSGPGARSPATAGRRSPAHPARSPSAETRRALPGLTAATYAGARSSTPSPNRRISGLTGSAAVAEAVDPPASTGRSTHAGTKSSEP